MAKVGDWTRIFMSSDPSPGEVDPRAFSCDFCWYAVLVKLLHSASHDADVPVSQVDRRDLLPAPRFSDKKHSGLAKR